MAEELSTADCVTVNTRDGDAVSGGAGPGPGAMENTEDERAAREAEQYRGAPTVGMAELVADLFATIPSRR